MAHTSLGSLPPSYSTAQIPRHVPNNAESPRQPPRVHISEEQERNYPKSPVNNGSSARRRISRQDSMDQPPTPRVYDPENYIPHMRDTFIHREGQQQVDPIRQNPLIPPENVFASTYLASSSRLALETLPCTEDDNTNDVERSHVKHKDYKARRKEMMRVRIQNNVTSLLNRQTFLVRLSKCLMYFGAPSHRIESQLNAAARILDVEAEFIHFPGVMICSFGNQESGNTETHFIKSGGRLALGALHKIHQIYRSVVHDEISALEATASLDAILNSPVIYSPFFRCCMAFCLSALICPLSFGGSFVDMWMAGMAAFILGVLQLYVTPRSTVYTNVFEITVTIFVAFVSRALSAIRSQVFCYTAISSAAIVGILPGYMILTSSLELASKNIVCGSVKMVYALIYTLFLGFGLQIGSDVYLLLDPTYRIDLDQVASSISSTISMAGTWTADNSSIVAIPTIGTWTFTHTVSPSQHDILDGCYRPSHFPWFLQPFPIWTSVILVPLFSLCLSLTNLQPFRSMQLTVMVIISCCAYASNKVANHYIFNRSDIVSAIGAFTVGLLGNIYSRKMGGTAFTSMVPGVLFLVPSGLSQAGGITANGGGIDIGGAMIAVTIGITVGLFMSQALVYMFGTRKNAAIFSF